MLKIDIIVALEKQPAFSKKSANVSSRKNQSSYDERSKRINARWIQRMFMRDETYFIFEAGLLAAESVAMAALLSELWLSIADPSLIERCSKDSLDHHAHEVPHLYCDHDHSLLQVRYQTWSSWNASVVIHGRTRRHSIQDIETELIYAYSSCSSLNLKSFFSSFKTITAHQLQQPFYSLVRCLHVTFSLSCHIDVRFPPRYRVQTDG
jgi:hypothetical protein